MLLLDFAGFQVVCPIIDPFGYVVLQLIPQGVEMRADGFHFLFNHAFGFYILAVFLAVSFVKIFAGFFNVS